MHAGVVLAEEAIREVFGRERGRIGGQEGFRARFSVRRRRLPDAPAVVPHVVAGGGEILQNGRAGPLRGSVAELREFQLRRCCGTVNSEIHQTVIIRPQHPCAQLL